MFFGCATRNSKKCTHGRQSATTLKHWSPEQACLTGPRKCFTRSTPKPNGKASAEARLLRERDQTPGALEILHPYTFQVGHGWIVDIMVETASGNELVVEVDGPQHYATCRHRAGTGVHPLGNTTIRDISLRRLGKRVVCLAAKDLDFHTNKKKTIKLLREKVQAADG
eukprot:1136949-Pelagomonas_calceolata.AAC.17